MEETGEQLSSSAANLSRQAGVCLGAGLFIDLLAKLPGGGQDQHARAFLISPFLSFMPLDFDIAGEKVAQGFARPSFGHADAV